MNGSEININHQNSINFNSEANGTGSLIFDFQSFIMGKS